MILFKTSREKDEWLQLADKNEALYDLIEAIAIFVDREFNKDVMLTEVYRSQEEHDKLYAQTPVHLRPKTSPHMRWEAVDLRSWLYTPVEIQRLLEFINCFRYNQGQKAAVYHAIRGNAPHFHVQYKGHKNG